MALGVDVGKFDLFVVCRWTDGRFERPWRVRNPKEVPALVALVTQIKAEREALVAMGPSGRTATRYGRRWPTRRSRFSGSVARRPMIMRRCSTASPRNTMARMPNSRRAGGVGEGQTLGVPGRRFLGGGTGVLGGRDGDPAADRHPLAGTAGGVVGALLARSVASAETFGSSPKRVGKKPCVSAAKPLVSRIFWLLLGAKNLA